MGPLIVYYKNKVLTIAIKSLKQGFGLDIYMLTGKDRRTFYLFQKVGNKWTHTSGELPSILTEAMIDALILRYNFGVVKVFWFRGQRQIVEVYHPNGGGGWVIKINYYYMGSITYNPDGNRFRWYILNSSWLKEKHMLYFIELIKKGKIESPQGYRIAKSLHE